MPPASVRATLDSDGGCDLSLSGEIDMAAVDGLNALGRCCLGRGHPLVIDLDAVTFLDAAALGALIGLRAAGLEAGTPIELARVPVGVARLLRLTRLDTEFATEIGARPRPADDVTSLADVNS